MSKTNNLYDTQSISKKDEINLRDLLFYLDFYLDEDNPFLDPGDDTLGNINFLGNDTLENISFVYSKLENKNLFTNVITEILKSNIKN